MSLYDLKVKKRDGSDLNLSDLEGKLSRRTNHWNEEQTSYESYYEN